MATIHSQQDGDWNTASTWDSGTVPTSQDQVHVAHRITFTASITAYYIYIESGGSLYVDDSATYLNEIKVTAQLISMYRQLDDTRKVNFDGCDLTALAHSSITANGSDSTWGPTNGIDSNTHVIIDDPGFLSCSTILRDIKPEGANPAYAEKISNAVRYVAVTVHIEYSWLRMLGRLYRMAQSPYQVLLATRSVVIKGFIESVVPDPASIGKEFVTVKVTITEGPGA